MIKPIYNYMVFMAIVLSIVLMGEVHAQNRRAKSKSKTSKSLQHQSPKISSGGAESAPVKVENDQIIIKDHQPEHDFVEKVNDKGEVNWSQKYVEAKGASIIDMARFSNPAQARLMAQRGAIVDAQRNLLEIVQGVQVQGHTTVQDMITVNDVVRTKVEGVIKNAVTVGDYVEKDGVITVTMRVPLYNNGVADAVIENVERKSSEKPKGDSTQEATPVTIKVNGNFKPSLFPKLTDEQNKVLIDLAESYGLPANKLPEIIKIGKETAEKLKGKKGIELIEVVQDQAGNLVLDSKNQQKLERWKKILRTGFKILRTILLPV